MSRKIRLFNGIRSRFVVMFLLIVIIVTLVMGTVLSINMSNYYDNQFTDAMNRVFTDDFIYQAERDLEQTTDPVGGLNRRLQAYTPQLGIDSYCNYFILDSQTGEVLEASDMKKSNQVTNTSAMLQALNGEIGTHTTADYMEFAVPIGNYIVYIYDSKEETKAVMNEVFQLIIQSVLIGVGFSLILSFFLSQNITKPITVLTKRATAFAGGDFESKSEDNLAEEEEEKVSGVVLDNSEDEIDELSNTFEYMAERLKSTMDAMEAEKTKIQTILQNMEEGVIAFDDEGKVVLMNPSARRLLSIWKAETVEFDRLFSDFGIDVSVGNILYVQEKGMIRHKLRLNGLYLSLYFDRIEMEIRKLGIVVGISDITEGEQLDLSRREFVANVSHELRTPLTTIKAYTETVISGNFEDKEVSKRFLEVVVDEVDRMTRMVSDLLMLSQLDHGRMSLKITRVRLESLLKRVSYKMEMNAKEQKQTLKLTLRGEIPDIAGDSDKLEQVLTNILSNSIKYTQEGGRIDMIAGSMGSNVYIRIIDNGIGIAPEDQKHIFERFYRADKARTRTAGGTGLGLAIAAQIIELHNGKITLASELGRGTEVSVLLPIDNFKPHPEK